MRLVLLPAVILRRPDPVSALGCRTRPKWARFHCEEACQVRSPTLHPWSYLPTNRNYAAVCVITHRVLSLENGFDGALVQPQEFQKDPRHTDGNTGVPLYLSCQLNGLQRLGYASKSRTRERPCLFVRAVRRRIASVTSRVPAEIRSSARPGTVVFCCSRLQISSLRIRGPRFMQPLGSVRVPPRPPLSFSRRVARAAFTRGRPVQLLEHNDGTRER